jgi:uncharacterized RDD family membrane protein YckC
MYDDKPKRREYELAGIGQRLIALIIDNLILAAVGAVLFGAARSSGGAVTLLVGLVYYWYFWTRQDGQTLGNRIMSIRVIKTDGGPISDTDAILRYLGYYINSFVFMIGWLWALFDSDRQGWHDKLANTYVVLA